LIQGILVRQRSINSMATTAGGFVFRSTIPGGLIGAGAAWILMGATASPQ
jgi:hypothetical protein